MPININDLSRLGDLKKSLDEHSVSERAIRAIEIAVRNGVPFGGEGDLHALDLPAADLATLGPIIDFGPRVTVVPNIKTIRFRVEPADPTGTFFGYQLVVGMPGASGIETEEVFPISDDHIVIVDFDLRKLPTDGVVVLRAKAPGGGYVRLDPDVASQATIDQIDVKVEELADRTIKVVADAVAPSDNPDILVSYPVRGRLITRDATGKLDGYQIVLFAATSDNPDDADFFPVASAMTESGGYFVTGSLLFTEAADLDRVAAAKARVSNDGVMVDLPIRIVVSGGDASIRRIPDRVILVLDERVEATTANDEPCGCNELNFHEKKVLEEFSYYTVVRTSEPAVIADVIADEPDINLQDIYGVPGFVPLSVFRKYHEIQSRQPLPMRANEAVDNLAGRAAMTTVAMPAIKTRSGASGLADQLRSPIAINTALLDRLVADHKASIVIKGNAKPRFRGRSHLSPTNQIYWDDTRTIYQAASIAHGHLLQFKQEWAPDGYSLGDIVYSLPLAPGQKKQIAVLDWERRESAAKSQELDYEEALSNTLVRDRDINEVVSGTLSENLRGSSKATSRGIGFGLGGAIMGVFSGGTYGGLFGISGGASSAGSNASQSSRRDMTSNSLQSITDRTQQSASAVRSQRATVVQTVSQGERVQATAESVANYNHCHAITIQYFEVLRHFKVRNRLANVQECLFVPLQMTRFDSAKCLRWRSSLERGLFRPEFARGFDAVARIQNEKESASENYYDSIGYPRSRYAEQAIHNFNGELYFEFFFFNTHEKKINDAITAFFNLFGISLDPLRDRQITDAELADHVGPRTIEQLLNAFIIRTDKGLDLKLDLTLNSRFRQSVPLRVAVRSSAQTPHIPRESFEALIVELDAAKLPPGTTAAIAQFTTYMKVTLRSGSLRYRGDHLAETLFNGRIDNDIFAGTDGAYLYTPLNANELKNPRGEDVEAANNLIHHLNENMEYYDSWLFMNFTPERRFMLLDGMIAPGKANGRSVASVVENRVIGIAGNSLILPVAPGYQLDPTIDDTFDMFAQYYDDPPEPMRLSMPTKGVYAEAVMGQCNSCEEKDETRFWRWEESPIPDSPNTQILPLDTGTRRTDPGSLDPKELPTPVVNIQNAPILPDPAALQTLIATLGKGDAFRDLTGLNQNQLNAAAAYAKALDTAEAFGKEASEMAQSMAKIQAALDAKKAGAISNEDAKEVIKKEFSGKTPEEEQAEVQTKLGTIEEAKTSKQIPEPVAEDLSAKAIDKANETQKTKSIKIKAAPKKKKIHLTLLFRDIHNNVLTGSWVVSYGNLINEGFGSADGAAEFDIEIDTSKTNVLKVKGNPYVSQSFPEGNQFYYHRTEVIPKVGEGNNLAIRFYQEEVTRTVTHAANATDEEIKTKAATEETSGGGEFSIESGALEELVLGKIAGKSTLSHTSGETDTTGTTTTTGSSDTTQSEVKLPGSKLLYQRIEGGE